jgi:hypothetical protein
MFSFNSQTENCVSPATPRLLANGLPLSVRGDRDNPFSRDAAMNNGLISANVGRGTAWETRRYRLKLSVTVSGSHRTPSPVRNQPLKSADSCPWNATARAKSGSAPSRVPHAVATSPSLRVPTDRPPCSPPPQLIRVVHRQPRQQLTWPPARPRTPQCQDRPDHRCREPADRRTRCRRAIQQTRRARRFTTRKPLVAGLSTDPVTGAQRRYRGFRA